MAVIANVGTGGKTTAVDDPVTGIVLPEDATLAIIVS